MYNKYVNKICGGQDTDPHTNANVWEADFLNFLPSARYMMKLTEALVTREAWLRLVQQRNHTGGTYAFPHRIRSLVITTSSRHVRDV